MTRWAHPVGWGLLLAASCSHGAASTLDPVRFENAAPVWVVDDRDDVPEPPRERRFLRNLYFFEETVSEPTERTLGLERFAEAQSVNALGEVPDSTWFTNRIGRHELSPAAVFEGPSEVGPPRLGPLVVKSTKEGGETPGVVLEDARGHRYVLKLDREGHPEQESAADAIVSRLLWASGYNVPEDHVVFLRRDDLVLADDAVRKRDIGPDVPLERRDLDALLATAAHDDQGRVRGLASKYLPGKPLGGHPVRGVREDDPNDVIPHELRRELRGQHVFFAWVNHTDVKPDNYLDMYVEDPDRPGHHFVRHYLLDFGKALGNLATIDRYPEDGFAYLFDFGYASASLATLGLWPRPWDALTIPDHRGVGRFVVEDFDPDDWKPYYPYLPIIVRDPRDDYWAAEILMRFRVEHLRAAVEAGRLSQPAAADYLIEVLRLRQRALGHWAFSRVAPFEDFEVVGSPPRLCFTDLWSRYGFDVDTGARLAEVRHQTFDFDGRSLGSGRFEPQRDRRWCSSAFTIGTSEESYTLSVIRALRSDRALPEVHVHLARSPETGRLRVVGIRRFAGT